MPELPRNLPHLYLRGNGNPETYTSKSKLIRFPLPQRDRTTHAEDLRAAFDTARAAADLRNMEREQIDTPEVSGFYLDFEIVPGSEYASELLESV